ncbi:MAG: hypothetical protein ACLR8Y_04130 [Alistipes indistinctus]
MIDPGVLLQEFIDRMTGQDKNQRAYTGRIDWGDLYPARVGILPPKACGDFKKPSCTVNSAISSTGCVRWVTSMASPGITYFVQTPGPVFSKRYDRIGALRG